MDQMAPFEMDDLKTDEVNEDCESRLYLWKPEEKARLEREGILLVRVRNGIRRVHPCILNLPTVSMCSDAKPPILPSASVSSESLIVLVRHT